MSNYAEIVPNLYMGNALAVGEAKKIARVVVLCAQEYQPALDQIPSGVMVFRAPYDDSGPPISEYEKGVAARAAAQVARYVIARTPVLVTCFAGRNRSGLVVLLALLMLHPNLDVDGAIALVRAARGEGALSNESFIEFARELKNQMTRRVQWL